MENMESKIKVKYRKTVKEFNSGVSLLEVAGYFQKNYGFPILVARVNNEIEGLDKCIDKSCTVDFFDRSSIVGNEIYSLGVHFLLIVAVNKVLGPSSRIVIQNSLDKGVYCELNKKIDETIIRRIELKMKQLIDKDYKFTKISVSRVDAIKFFEKKKQYDKSNLLKYISNSYINLYRFDDYYDYFFSDLPTSTGYIDSFKITCLNDYGLVLSYPSVYDPSITYDYSHKDKLFDTFTNYSLMCDKIGISNVSELNKIVSTGKYNDIIQLSEAYYNNQLSNIANMINDKCNVKVVLLAGPSSSGKTTTCKKLSIYLKAMGYKIHNISIDDYFFDRDSTPVKPNGEFDFESLRAIDTDLFNKDLLKLLSYERVLLPEYNFMLGKREYKNNYLELGDNDIIIIEGLHALNDDLTLAVDAANKFKIYISPLTQLNIDDHNRIHTSDTRRLRRIIRDNKHRNFNASDTLKNWKNISEGEEMYIYPYQNSVDVIMNSSLLYEIGVLKTYAEPLLYSVSEDDDSYPEAIRLINFLRNFLPIPSDEVPKESVLREFIGGSNLN